MHDNLNQQQRRYDRPWSQDSFLNQIRKSKSPLVLFLINGVKIQGTLIHFDQHILILRREGLYQLIYKHAISTLIPQGAVFSQDSSAQEALQN